MKFNLPLVFVGMLISQLLIADVLEFNNGDRLQGELISMQAGKMKFNAAMLGEIEVAMDKLRAFETAKPAAIHFEDGTVLQQRVQTNAAGVAVAAGAVVAAQSIPIDQISMINPPPEPPVEWKGRVTAGLTIATGNTETQDTHVDIDAQRETKTDRIILDADFIENKEENTETGIETTSKRRYALGAHYDFFIAKDWYIYGDVGAEKEVTANLDLRMTIGAGGGYRWLNSDTTQLDVETGLGWVSENFSDTSADEDYLSARFAWRYNKSVTKIANFFHRGEWFPSLENSDDHLVKTETGIRTRLMEILSAEAKVIFDWDNTPAIDKENEDLTYVIGVGWEF